MSTPCHDNARHRKMPDKKLETTYLFFFISRLDIVARLRLSHSIALKIIFTPSSSKPSSSTSSISFNAKTKAAQPKKIDEKHVEAGQWIPSNNTDSLYSHDNKYARYISYRKAQKARHKSTTNVILKYNQSGYKYYELCTEKDNNWISYVH